MLLVTFIIYCTEPSFISSLFQPIFVCHPFFWRALNLSGLLNRNYCHSLLLFRKLTQSQWLRPRDSTIHESSLLTTFPYAYICDYKFMQRSRHQHVRPLFRKLFKVKLSPSLGSSSLAFHFRCTSPRLRSRCICLVFVPETIVKLSFKFKYFLVYGIIGLKLPDMVLRKADLSLFDCLAWNFFLANDHSSYLAKPSLWSFSPTSLASLSCLPNSSNLLLDLPYKTDL